MQLAANIQNNYYFFHARNANAGCKAFGSTKSLRITGKTFRIPLHLNQTGGEGVRRRVAKLLQCKKSFAFVGVSAFVVSVSVSMSMSMSMSKAKVCQSIKHRLSRKLHVHIAFWPTYLWHAKSNLNLKAGNFNAFSFHLFLAYLFFYASF